MKNDNEIKMLKSGILSVTEKDQYNKHLESEDNSDFYDEELENEELINSVDIEKSIKNNLTQ